MEIRIIILLIILIAILNSNYVSHWYSQALFRAFV